PASGFVAPAPLGTPALPAWSAAVTPDDSGAYDDFAADEEAGEYLREGASAEMAAPPPSAPMPRAMAKRRASAPGGMPPPMPAAAPAFGRARGAAPPIEVQAAVVFARLRLGAHDDAARRGMLRPESLAETYRESLQACGRRVDFDPAAIVRLAEMQAREIERLSLPASAVAVDRSADRFDYAYAADARVEVPGDGAWHSVPLGVRAMPCDLHYVVVPRESTHVFRLARLQNPTHAPMLAGPVDVYVDGAYVLSSALPSVGPQARFELGLGVEQGIRCARNARFEEARSDERVVAMTELRHTLDIELANHLGRAAPCEVRERIPQAAEGAEVVVEETAVEPPWENWTQARQGRPIAGGRRWLVTVAPHSKRALAATYVVKIYANHELVGGNRREA
ncbi:MAG: DUF4139 domain-containing protein, partial [Myxococcales bacterium]|nr:DUF4139 domain-containing protein [Myxococcales bacterium]